LLVADLPPYPAPIPRPSPAHRVTTARLASGCHAYGRREQGAPAESLVGQPITGLQGRQVQVAPADCAGRATRLPGGSGAHRHDAEEVQCTRRSSEPCPPLSSRETDLRRPRHQVRPTRWRGHATRRQQVETSRVLDTALRSNRMIPTSFARSRGSTLRSDRSELQWPHGRRIASRARRHP
jgi:hypothetical protein